MLHTNDLGAAVPLGRVAAEHALNRSLNDRLSACEAAAASDLPWLLVCECGRRDCAETVEVSPTEYAAVRSREGLYLVAPDHGSPAVTELILEIPGRFWIVELLRSAEAAARREPVLGAGRDVAPRPGSRPLIQASARPSQPRNGGSE